MQQFTGFIFFYATNRFPEDVKCVLKILVYESSFPKNVITIIQFCIFWSLLWESVMSVTSFGINTDIKRWNDLFSFRNMVYYGHNVDETTEMLKTLL